MSKAGGLSPTLGAAGVTLDSLAPMARAADAVRMSNNPRAIGPDDVLRILELAF